MKKINFKYALIFLTTLISQLSFAAGLDDFIMQIKTNHPGTSADNEFTIQTTGSGYNYNVDCDLDGTFEATAQTGNYVCVYGSAGNKFIRIEDNNGDGTGFPRIFYNHTGDHRKILDVVQWGTGKWTSMAAAFRGAQNMQLSAGDVPDLSTVTDLSSMFRFATIVNPDTSLWDVSGVTTFHSMFRSASNATPDTSNWDTSSAQIMTNMFWNATSVNPNVSSWDVSGVTDMTLMFGNVTLPTATYDSMLITFESQLVQNNVTLDGGNSKYCSLPAQIAHAKLMTDHIWTINDGGICAPSDPVNDFVFTIISFNSGDPADASTFTIPTTGTGYKYNVDCNDDGSFEATGLTGSYVCDYSSLGGPGTYTIRIQDGFGDGTGFPRVKFGLGGAEASEIIELNNWGTGLWDSMEAAFENTSTMQVLANDAPDLSNVTNVSKMFLQANDANPDTSSWDTSNIFNMSQMFLSAWDANPDTSNWDTSNVTDMSFMFFQATSAQPDTSNWDTGEVKFMQGMFAGTSLADPIASNWNIGNVSDMSDMFNGTSLSLSNYDAMLINFASQSVQQGVVFHGGQNSKYCAIPSHASLESNNGWNITDQGIAPVCAHGADDFIITVNTANTQAGSSSATQFTIPITTNPTILGNYDYNVDCDLANIGTNIATGVTADYTCNYAVPGIYTLLISDNTGLKTGFPAIQTNSNDDNLKIIELNQWGTGIWSTMTSAFYFAENMTVNAIDAPDLSMVTSLSSMFSHAYLANPDTSNWDTSNIQSMGSIFFNATSANPDVSTWSTNQVLNMSLMFSGATTANPDVSDWVTSNVVTMYRMFHNASSANPNVSGWITSSVTNMESMFDGAVLANPDVGDWVTSSVTTMQRLFTGASIATPDVSTWNTSSVTMMTQMFSGATLANPNVSNWITSSVTDMREMFSSASNANPDVSGWDTANVINMNAMFRFATSADPDLSSWDIENVIHMSVMFLGVTLSQQNYDALLVNFSLQSLHLGVTFHGGNSTYCDIAAHDIIENTFGWNISDGGLDAGCPSDIIFSNGFEDVVVFKSTASQFEYDFAKTVPLDLDEQPLLIARGINAIQLTIIEVYLRNDLGQLQIRKDNFDHISKKWIVGEWQSIDNTELTTVSW